MTKNFSVTTLSKRMIKETIMTILYYVATKIRIERKEAVSRQYNFCSNIKSLRLTDELCCNKRRFCHDNAIGIHNKEQHNLCRDKDYSVATNKT